MVQRWEPGTQYDNGSVVEFEGRQYKVIQPHRSQGDWTPPVTPALWGLIPGGGYQSQQQQYQQQPQQYQQQQQQQVPLGGYAQHPDQKVDISHEEQKKNWYDLDDDRKQQLEIGGGLLAGAALLGGGYMAWKSHEKNEEEEKALTWSLQNWVKDAQTRTDQYHREGPRGPVAWILNQGRNIPPNAIPGGEERGGKLFICRAFQDGGIQLGKASDVFQKGAVIGYKNDEIHLDTYEILVGDERGVRWVDASGRLNVDALGAKPVEGGRENDGTPLFIIQAPHKGAVHPGKASPKLGSGYIPYGGEEVGVGNYRVLCYA